MAARLTTSLRLLTKAALLCSLAATDKDLAEFFDKSEVTVNAWNEAPRVS
ncbi:hypothetical protein [Bradyrhizobium sp. ERR14]|nr:hypothetical protein [Bradyrhizobium sp. ERR14]MBB4393709.1 hypothetical protein [Bradyrhizobium sp. ERR14]